jgi:hypothetical protein
MVVNMEKRNYLDSIPVRQFARKFLADDCCVLARRNFRSQKFQNRVQNLKLMYIQHFKKHQDCVRNVE